MYERPENLFVAGFLGAPAMNFIAGHLDLQQQFTSDKLQVSLASYALKAPISIIAGEKLAVTMGVRPEHIHLDPNGDAHGSVVLVEPMGNHMVLWLDLGGQTISMIVNEPQQFELGSTVRFRIDGHRVSLFDPATEQRL